LGMNSSWLLQRWSMRIATITQCYL